MTDEVRTNMKSTKKGLMVSPKYGTNIIVLLIHQNIINWYVTDKEIWYLDLRKLISAFEKKGYKVPNSQDFTNRFNIDIITEENADILFTEIECYKVETNVLKKILINKEYGHISDMAPSIYINFDKKLLISQFPEPASFEKYVPNGWTGCYQKFIELIPKEFRYWISDGKDLFSEVKNG